MNSLRHGFLFEICILLRNSVKATASRPLGMAAICDEISAVNCACCDHAICFVSGISCMNLVFEQHCQLLPSGLRPQGGKIANYRYDTPSPLPTDRRLRALSAGHLLAQALLNSLRIAWQSSGCHGL